MDKKRTAALLVKPQRHYPQIPQTRLQTQDATARKRGNIICNIVLDSGKTGR